MHIAEIDRWCDLYEERWKTGNQVSVEEFLCAHKLTSEAELVWELRRVEVEMRQLGELMEAERRCRQGLEPRPGSSPSSPPVSARSDSGAPRTENRYRLVDKIAQGGLGKIWRAEDTAIRREIAFKELLASALESDGIIERFVEEAQITGQLEHPGIVPIYDLGQQADGTPYYAMKLVKGGTMEQAIAALHALPKGGTDWQLAFTRLLRQWVGVCQAVGFAHEKGVLHRDLKPLNVMLGEFGETLVLDWGLAKLLPMQEESEVTAPQDEPITATNSESFYEAMTVDMPLSAKSLAPESASERGSQRRGSDSSRSSRRLVATDARSASSQTVTGQVLGTPAYMAPEQAQGLTDQLTARSDIYSLGGMLYKLLTNRTPITGKGAHEVLRKVAAGAIKPPREIDSSIPPPLEAICLKALSRRPADRYGSAVALASDVEAWLADEPVSVYSDPWYHRLRRWSKRHRTAVLSSSAALLVAIIGMGLWMTLEARRVDGLRRDTLAKVDDARTAIERTELSKANTLLIEALGQVRTEAKLAPLRDRVQGDLDNVARLQAASERGRLATLSLKAERLFDQAQQATEGAKDFAQARTLLTEAVTLLAQETSLAELHRRAEQRLVDVNQTLAQRAEVDTAQAQLAKFAAAVEDVRVFGGNVSGEDSVDDLKQARQRGLAALELFEIDFTQPNKLDARLRLLGPDAIDQWKSGLLELLVTIAQAETNLAIKDQPDDVTAAAKRSLEFLQHAEVFRMTSRPVGLLRADLLATLGQGEAAQQTLAAAEQLPASTRLDHFLLAERARRFRKFGEAIEHLQDVLHVDPNDYWSLNLMGICHLNQGQPAAAAANFTACIARRPDFVWPYISRAIALADLDQFEIAHRDLTRASELSPRNYAVLLNRGFVFLLQKNYASAKAEFTAAAELRPDLAAPHLNLAETSRRRAEELVISKAQDGVVRAAAEFQAALVELTTALPLAPQQAAIYRVRGQVHVALNDPAAALADQRRSLRLETNPTLRAVSWREIGLIQQRAKRFPEALSAFDQSLTQVPRDTNVIRQRADVLLSLERFDEAIAGFTAFLDKAGPVGDVYRARSLAFTRLNKTREAINDYTMSLQFEPAPNMLKQRGKAYLLEANKLAKEDFEEALRLNPLDPDSRWGLAHALVLMDDHAAAAAELEKADAVTKQVVAKYGPQVWALFFNPATTYAQAHAKALVDPKLSAERREELATKYVTRAIELLTQAQRAAGPNFAADFQKELRGDTLLNPIRQRPEFLEALKSLTPATKP